MSPCPTNLRASNKDAPSEKAQSVFASRPYAPIEYCTVTGGAAVENVEGYPYALFDFTDFYYELQGWRTSDYSEVYNNPNVGITGLKEGQVVQTGEPLVVEGYADSFGLETIGLEVSLDRGATWKRFDIIDTAIERLITWEFEFTPETDGAYYIGVRAVNEEGTVTVDPVEKMIIARSDIADIEPVSLDAE